MDWTLPARKVTVATRLPGPRSYSHCSVSWHGSTVLAHGSGTGVRPRSVEDRGAEAVGQLRLPALVDQAEARVAFGNDAARAAQRLGLGGGEGQSQGTDEKRGRALFMAALRFMRALQSASGLHPATACRPHRAWSWVVHSPTCRPRVEVAGAHPRAVLAEPFPVAGWQRRRRLWPLAQTEPSLWYSMCSFGFGAAAMARVRCAAEVPAVSTFSLRQAHLRAAA